MGVLARVITKLLVRYDDFLAFGQGVFSVGYIVIYTHTHTPKISHV